MIAADLAHNSPEAALNRLQRSARHIGQLTDIRILRNAISEVKADAPMTPEDISMTHSEHTPISVTHKTTLRQADDVAEAAERLDDAASDGEHGIEAGIQVYHSDVRALLASHEAQAAEIERLKKAHSEVVGIFNNRKTIYESDFACAVWMARKSREAIGLDTPDE